jgi:Tol biopolymer transport system component
VRLWLVFLGLLPVLLVGAGPGAVASTPALAAHNGLIAVPGVEGLQIVDPATGVVTSMPDTADMGEPAWSPDGTLLAITKWTENGPEVHTMKSDGSERHLVLPNASSPSWSPDGKRIVVERDSCFAPDGCATEEEVNSTLVTVDAEGNNLEALATIPGYVDSVEWSPDGKHIAFFAEQEIRLISADGAEDTARTIAKGSGVLVRSLSWSPDSSRLAFDRVQKGTQYAQVIVVLDVATGAETTLRGEQEGAWAPVWSPDGKQLAFLSQGPERVVGLGCGDHLRSELWAMDSGGLNARQLAKGGDFYAEASWARAVESAPQPVDAQPVTPPEVVPPVARDTSTSTSKPVKPVEPAAPEEVPAAPVAEAVPKAAIAVRGSNAIYLVDPDTAAAHKVPGTADMIAPAWSPDDSLLAVERVGKAGGSSVYTIKPDGTQPQLVLENASAPSWSSSCDRIFVLRNECAATCEPEDDEANVLYSVRPDGSGLQQVDAEADVSATRELAWRTDGSPIWFFDEGSANSPGSFDTSAAEWAPDESRIAFIGALGPTDDEASENTVTAGLWIVSAEGGTPKLLLEGASGRPSWP